MLNVKKLREMIGQHDRGPASIRVILGREEKPHEMGTKNGNVKIRRKIRRP